MPDCPFCQSKEILMNEAPLVSTHSTRCRRGIYQDDSCFAILAPEQYTPGHTLLILQEHRTDITVEISREKLTAFIDAINKVSRHLKEVAENRRGERPERIYVSILCDGVTHLHAHLIPRYPFDQADKDVYAELFSRRDGAEEVAKKQREGRMGGFWYIAAREAHRIEPELASKMMQESEQVRILEELASKLYLE